MIGWNKFSIGLHSDDGKLFYEKGIGKDFSKGFGLKPDENHIVGCGFDSIKKEVFFVLDGKKFEETIQLPWDEISAAFAFDDFEEIEINYGNEKPFIFDLYKEYENNGYLN